MQIPELTPDVRERFWSKVNKDGTIPPHKPELGKCWIWTGGLCRGYGKFRIGNRNNGKLFISTRVSYFIATGIQPDPFHALHRCDNPPCVNPSHLFLGTDADNIKDAVAKGRNYLGYKIKHRPIEKTARGMSSGAAKLTNENVVEIANLLKKRVPNKEIAFQFGVRPSSISNIKNGINWSHITGIEYKKRTRLK